MKKCLIVVTPAKNEEKFILHTIKAVLNQTYPVTAHVILDDFSTDRTIEVIEGLHDSRLHVIRKEKENIPYTHGVTMRVPARVHKVAPDLHAFIDQNFPDWDYLVKLDADTIIPPHYCETIIRHMEHDSLLVMAGARYLRTPAKTEKAPLIHNRNCNHIIQGWFYRKAELNGITYNGIHGEIALERYAWSMGYKAMPIESLTAVELRPTSIKESELDLKWYYIKGMEQFRLGIPLFALIIHLPLNFGRRRIYALSGWFHAFFFRFFADFLTPKQKATLRLLHLSMFWKGRLLGKFKRRKNTLM